MDEEIDLTRLAPGDASDESGQGRKGLRLNRRQLLRNTALAGAAEVTLLEAEDQPGYHATGRSAASEMTRVTSAA